jgi:D-alanyl-D-alanine endopeptidase (penicillin-binding protein 7)
MKRRPARPPWKLDALRPGAALLAVLMMAGCQRAPTDEAARSAPLPDAPAVAAAPAAPATSAAEPAASTASDANVAVNEAQEAEAPAAPETHDADSALPDFIPRPGDSHGHLAGLHKVPDPLKLRSSVAYVIDAGTREVLLAKNEGAVLPIASLTKLMTALVVREAGQPLDEVLTVTEDDVDREKNSRSRLRVGTTLTRDDALHLALMSSENRAAHALARAYPGGLEAFVRAMNAKAKQLALNDTTFADPTGLSSANQSTARDLAKLAAAAGKDPLVRAYSTTPGYLMPVGKRVLQYRNSNRLVKRKDWQIALQKTGYTTEAGQCLVMHTKLGGRDAIVVLLDAADKASRSRDADRIRQWAGGEHTASHAAGKRS